MKNRTYVPACVSAGAFRGSVVVAQFTFKERFDYVEKATAAREAGSYMPFLMELVEACKDRFVSIDLERVADKEKFTSFDSLQYGSDCHSILIEVATWLINGDAKSGKPEETSSESKSAP